MRFDKPRSLERYPKQPDDDLPPQMELLETDEGHKWAFRDVGLRIEIDGEEYVPGPVSTKEGCVVLHKASDRDGMVVSDDRDVRIYADMDSDLLALGANSNPGGYDD